VSDIGKALTVPCPGCKMPADAACVDLETGAKVEGVHSNRLYRAYVVAEAVAHNRAIELTAILRDLVDPDPCHFDHHGHCQAHGWTDAEPSCPHARAKEYLEITQ
jgi:hypothetical protein